MFSNKLVKYVFFCFFLPLFVYFYFLPCIFICFLSLEGYPISHTGTHNTSLEFHDGFVSIVGSVEPGLLVPFMSNRGQTFGFEYYLMA